MIEYPGDEMAKQAFDVMMRRGWWPIRRHDKADWKAFKDRESPRFDEYEDQEDEEPVVPSDDWSLNWWPDPFTALVEADRWYVANVEDKADAGN
jgi:hypothetical protein